jgi:hypothetical protein
MIRIGLREAFPVPLTLRIVAAKMYQQDVSIGMSKTSVRVGSRETLREFLRRTPCQNYPSVT